MGIVSFKHIFLGAFHEAANVGPSQMSNVNTPWICKSLFQAFGYKKISWC